MLKCQSIILQHQNGFWKELRDHEHSTTWNEVNNTAGVRVLQPPCFFTPAASSSILYLHSATSVPDKQPGAAPSLLDAAMVELYK